MAKADQLLSLGQWPPEGRTLGAIVKQLTSPAAWSEVADLTGEGRILGNSYLVRLEAVEKCQPLLLLWNSGVLVAKGRRGDPLSSPVEIPPPSTVWELRVANFARSVIEDPIGQGKQIFDLRFFPKQSKGRTRTKPWIEAEARRLKATGEVTDGTRKTTFAKKLEARMSKAHDDGDKSIKLVGWRHINNMLPTWGLWPIASIK